MTKALRVTMIVYAVIGILFGLAYILIPRQIGAFFGFEEGPESVAAMAAVLGVSWVSACIFIIIAARDPLKHILWVKYAIVFAILSSAAELYSLILGYIDFSQAGMGIIMHAVFAAALLAFYPWRVAKESQ
jgi:hypothetical protein